MTKLVHKKITKGVTLSIRLSQFICTYRMGDTRSCTVATIRFDACVFLYCIYLLFLLKTFVLLWCKN